MTVTSGEGNRPRLQKRRESGRPGYVRIIGGAWRGRRLTIPRGAVLRPTPDRVRETLFNWLAPEIEGAVCVDLFAGTGSLGFEALSRGAAEVWLVERDAAFARVLAEHAAALGVGGVAGAGAGTGTGAGAQARIEWGSALDFLRRSKEPRFDIAFLDPPFADPIEPLLAAVGPRLRPHALVYVERSVEAGLPEAGTGRWVKSSRAGAVVYGLLRFDAPAHENED